jgi:hypothetical protein
MSYIVYFFVALIAAASVLFGLDPEPAPMSPMPLSQYALRAAVPPPPSAPAIVSVEPKAEPAAAPAAAPAVPAKPPVAVAARPAQGPVPPTALDQQPASIAAAEPGSAKAAAPVASASPPACNVEACAAAYRSFTAADCTFQPSDGPRRLCSKGAPPAAPVAAAPASPASISPATTSPATTAAAPAAEARAHACNVAACSQSYPRSFNAADCTFKPAEGPRKTCTR